MDASFPEVNVDEYHFIGLEDFISVLLFLHHSEPFLEHISSRETVTGDCYTSRSSSLMALAFFLNPAFFFSFD